MEFPPCLAAATVALMITCNIQAQSNLPFANSPLAQASALGALAGTCLGLLRILQHYRQEYENNCEIMTITKRSYCKYYLTILALHVLSGAMGSTIFYSGTGNIIPSFWVGLWFSWFLIERPKQR